MDSFEPPTGGLKMPQRPNDDAPLHLPETWAETLADGRTAFFAFCPCGWRGADHGDEMPADFERLSHAWP